MSILSSREHSCVNPDLQTNSNKNEKCNDLRSESKLTHNSRPPPTAHSILNNIESIWFGFAINNSIVINNSITIADACVYFSNQRKLTNAAQVLNHAWDVEELANMGRDVIGCPYYSSVIGWLNLIRWLHLIRIYPFRWVTCFYLTN